MADFVNAALRLSARATLRRLDNRAKILTGKQIQGQTRNY
jgi:hypothetical protein